MSYVIDNNETVISRDKNNIICLYLIAMHIYLP